MLIHTQETNAFTIQFFALPPDDNVFESFDECNAQEVSDKIDSGEYVHFLAKVTASKNGIELSSDYLGSCVYNSYMEFVEHNDYFADMVTTVVDEAKEVIKTLCKE